MSPIAPNRPPLPKIEVKDRSRSDASFLDLISESLDPARHYRWIRCRSDEHMIRVNKMKFAGYTLETLREGGPRTVSDTDRRPDGVIAVGDLILMSCPRAIHEKRLAAIQAKTDSLLASTSAQTKEMAKEKGISVIQDSDHNA